ADASFVMEAAGPIRGHVDLATFTVDTTAAFRVRLARLTPHGTSLNLVGDGCTTTSPVTVTMHGVVNPATGGTFASTYTIPTFEHCGALTPAITAFVSGPGNTFVASFAPHGAQPPTPPTTTQPPAPPLATADVHAQVALPPAAGATADGRVRVTVPAPTPPADRDRDAHAPAEHDDRATGATAAAEPHGVDPEVGPRRLSGSDEGCRCAT